MIYFKKHLLFISFLCSIGIYAQTTYCSPGFTFGCDGGDNIDDFNIPSVGFSHESTGCSTGGYGDFTSQTITMQPLVSYQFTIKHGYDKQRVKIWADFNNNGTFDEASETIGSAIADNKISVGNILIPETVTPGTYRMRVATKYSDGVAYPEPCNNTNDYGEAHDYTLQVLEAPTCIQPNSISITNIGNSEATLTLTATTPPSNGYEYYYTTSNTPPNENTNALGTSNTNAFTIYNLNPETTYHIWVRAVCSNTDKSQWLGIDITTDCPIYTSDYLYNFDEDQIPNINKCWSKKVENPTNSYYVMENYNNSAIANSNVFKIYNYTDINGTYYLISPKFGDLNQHKKIEMDIRKSIENDADGDIVEIGVMTDATDTSTYTLLQNIPLSDLIENDWKTISINTANYTGGAGHIVFKYKPNGKKNAFYIDNFKYVNTSNCTKPSNLQVSDITATTCNVSWSGTASSNYEYYYSTNNTTPTSETNAMGNINTNHMEMSEMNSNTDYYLWVRKNCSDTDKSQWSDVLNFHTPQILATSEINIRDLKGVQLYPNPFQDIVYINNITGIETITIVDMTGKVVQSLSPNKTLNLSKLNTGIYLIRLSYKDGSVKTLKAIKE